MVLDKAMDSTMDKGYQTITEKSELPTSPIKSARFETHSTFCSYFTKYSSTLGNFIPSKKIKFNTQHGGVPVGQIEEYTLVDSSDAHTMVLGSTGSKKSRLVIMPTIRILADAGESMVISDPKSEIFERTSGYLIRKGYHISVVNLRDPRYGNSWNPLFIPYQYYIAGDLDKAYEFANDIAANLCLAEITAKDPFWDYSARDLFFGLELLLFKYCSELSKDVNTVNIENLLRLRHYLFKNYYQSGTNHILDEDSILNKYMNSDFITSSALIGTVNAPERTQSSILSTFDEKMRCFTIQPTLLNMLSSNSIVLDHLGESKNAIYIIMPDEKTTYHKLVSLFIKQSYEYIIYHAQKKESGSLKIRINYILDEFASLPAIKDFSAMIAASRSRNIRFVLVVQSKHQLIDKYGNEAITIQSNCSNWIFLTSREGELLNELSLLCGRKRNVETLLVPPDSLQHLSKEKGEALVLCGRLYPYISRLPDIDKYDHGEINRAMDIKPIKISDNILDFSNIQQNIDSTLNKGPNIKRNSMKDKIENTDESEYDIQKELEKKFDELFGTITDD